MFERKEDFFVALTASAKLFQPCCRWRVVKLWRRGRQVSGTGKYCKFHLGTGRVGACMRRRRLTWEEETPLCIAESGHEVTVVPPTHPHRVYRCLLYLCQECYKEQKREERDGNKLAILENPLITWNINIKWKSLNPKIFGNSWRPDYCKAHLNKVWSLCVMTRWRAKLAHIIKTRLS